MAVHATSPFDDTEHVWWGTLGQVTVIIALAGALSLAAGNAELAQATTNGNQDETIFIGTSGGFPPVQPSVIYRYTPEDIAFAPAFSPEEEFWQNQVSPIQYGLYQRLPYVPDPEELPANTLFGTPDENEYWSSLLAPPQPIGLGLYQVLPYQPDTEEPTAVLFGQAEEYFEWNLYWGLPRPQAFSLFQLLPYQPDPEEISAGNLFGQYDEDFWINPVAPVPGSLYQKLPYLPDIEEATATLEGVPVEDFWQNWVPPSWLALYQKLPYLPDIEEPTAVLFGQPVEDFEWNLYWGQPRPQPFSLFQLLPYQPDPEEIPAGNLYGVPVEDFWHVGWLPPYAIPLSLYQKLPYIPELEGDVPAGVLFNFLEDEYWLNPNWPVLIW